MPLKKRVTVRLKRPNPLFEEWLTEWREDAKKKDSKMQFCFSAALQSLKKYPLPLETGRDCKILKGFGDKLCRMLDEKLKRYKADESDETDCKIIGGAQVEQKITNKEGTSKTYTPQYRSGGYAILVSLYKNTIESDGKEFLTKDEIVKDASFHCDVSFTKFNSSMRTLIGKNLVKKQGNPAKFSLTPDGVFAARKIYSEERNVDSLDGKENFESQKKIEKKGNLEMRGDSVPDISELINNKIIDLTDDENVNDNVPSAKKKLTQKSSVIFEPNSFEIILLVDTAETSGVKQAQDDPIISDLLRLGTNFEIRHLKIGDYTWICRHGVTKAELVLPYIIERKRMDDFGHSIRDGRYHEQKFRLNQCGIQNVIYLIESYGKNVHVGLPMTTLMQAAANTLLQDGFQVKFSENAVATARYLNAMSRIVTESYKGRTIMSCSRDNLDSLGFDAEVVSAMTFTEFSKVGSKHKLFTVKEMFIRHLLQLKGLSVDKALAIVEKYPTPKLLIDNYRGNPETAEKLLADIVFGKGKKTIGPVISKVVHRLYATSF